MFTVKPVRNVLIAALILAPMGAIELTTARPITAQPQNANQQFGGFFSPKGNSSPKQSQGGASRGICSGDSSSLDHEMSLITLVTPKTNQGLSSAARPVFLAHVSPSLTKQIYFSLKNEDESYFYDQTITPTSSGMLRFQLPDDAPALEVGEQYQWSVALICGDRLAPDSPWASGAIELTDQVELSTESMTPMERASAYGRAGLWYETVDSLMRMVESESSPQARTALRQLLNDEGLTSISSKLVAQLSDNNPAKSTMQVDVQP